MNLYAVSTVKFEQNEIDLGSLRCRSIGSGKYN